MLKKSTLFALHSFVEIPLGIIVLISPTFIPSIVGSIPTGIEGMNLWRTIGLTILSLGVLTWRTRNDSSDSKLMHEILLALVLFHFMTALVDVHAQLLQTRGGLGWVLVAGHLFFGVMFCTQLCTGKKSTS